MSIPGSTTPLLLKSAATAQYNIERSIRLNAQDSTYLSRTPASAGNRKTWTWSGWIKRSKVGVGISQSIFGATPDNYVNNYTWLRFSGDNLYINHTDGSGGARYTTALYRDPSAWMHVVVALDTTQAVAADRLKLYVNGVIPPYTGADPGLNEDWWINAANPHYLNAIATVGATYGQQLGDHYLADVFFIDGQALAPTSFGKFDDNGVWQPKAYTGTYPGNSFHLDFADNSSAAALGTDTSGNSNTWTPTNFSLGLGGGYPSDLSAPGGLRTSEPASFAFDGSLSTGAATISDAVTITWSPSTTVTATTSLQILMQDFLGGVATVNGISMSQGAVGPNGSDHYYNYTGSFPITITSLTSKSNGQASRLYAILIDGVIFLNAAVVASGNDSLVDTPTSYGTDDGLGGSVRGNYCTWNPVDQRSAGSAAFSFTNGNLEAVNVTNAYGNIAGTIFASSGKWYWEIVTTGTVNGLSDFIGIIADNSSRTSAYPSNTTNSYWYRADGKTVKNLDGNAGVVYGASWVSGDVIGVALDADNKTLTFYKNGVSQGVAFTGLDPSASWTPAVGDFSNALTLTSWIANFGQRPFAYTAPSGFKALCTTNLPAPTIAKPNTVMDVKLYTGNSSTQTISGLGFSPDFVWIKSRSQAYHGTIYDIIRGTGKILYPSLTNSEETFANSLIAFNSDGFSLGSDSTNASNLNGATHVAWTWDAGSSTVTNTQGSITSSVRANASAGFSIVTYTGTGANATVGHGLGVAPSMLIVKSRNDTYGWKVYHSSVGNGSSLVLNSTAASASDPAAWNSTSPTSSVFSIGNGTTNASSSTTYVAYCFAPVAGYSSFGSYVGNGSADGPFVYTGFRPRWLLLKNSTQAGTNWLVVDSARNTYNPTNLDLLANSSAIENNYTPLIDFLSNGFKFKQAQANYNSSGESFVFAAFAESPFQYARAR